MSSGAAPPPSLTAGAVPGGSGPVPGASAGATEACPLCGAPLAPEQEWCLRCGAAARTRLATSSNWKAPIVAIALVAVLSLGVLAVALIALAGGFESSSSIPATTIVATRPAAVPAPTATTPATPAGATAPHGVTPTATAPHAAAPRTTGPSHPATSPAAGNSAPLRIELHTLEVRERNSPSPIVKKRVAETIAQLRASK